MVTEKQYLFLPETDIPEDVFIAVNGKKAQETYFDGYCLLYSGEAAPLSFDFISAHPSSVCLV